MPPAKSPSRNRGVIVSSMMRFATRSVSAPSRPQPTSMRSARSSFATSSSAPSSGFSRPSFQASTTRIEYCSIASGCVVGTISTAICAPLRASNAASFSSSAARSRRVERAGEVGDARCERRHRLQRLRPGRRRKRERSAASAARSRPADPRHRTRLLPQVAGSAGGWAGVAGAVLKSTVGGLAISASFSTVKFGFTS